MIPEISGVGIGSVNTATFPRCRSSWQAACRMHLCRSLKIDSQEPRIRNTASAADFLNAWVTLEPCVCWSPVPKPHSRTDTITCTMLDVVQVTPTPRLGVLVAFLSLATCDNVPTRHRHVNRVCSCCASRDTTNFGLQQFSTFAIKTILCIGSTYPQMIAFDGFLRDITEVVAGQMVVENADGSG